MAGAFQTRLGEALPLRARRLRTITSGIKAGF